jgi:hypothetical protein
MKAEAEATRQQSEARTRIVSVQEGKGDLRAVCGRYEAYSRS